jgi:hypothetical protein
LQAEGPEVDAVRRRVGEAGVGLVHEPAAIGGAAEDPRQVDEDPAEDQRPQAEGVQAGEGDVTGTDLERQEVVAERRRHRHGEQEDHRRGVHREHLVVQIRREHGAVRTGELGSDEQGFDAADEKEHKGGDAVHDPDALVVDREQPRPPAGGGHRAPEHAEGRRGSDGRWRRPDCRNRSGTFNDGHC